MTENKNSFFENWEISAVLTVIGIIILFSASIMVILIAPTYVDPTWTQPTSTYQVQMYEISDPNIYFGTTYKGSSQLQAVYHLKEGNTLLSFQESEVLRIVAPPDLQRYITRSDDPKLKLTHKLLMVRKPQKTSKADLMLPLNLKNFAMSSKRNGRKKIQNGKNKIFPNLTLKSLNYMFQELKKLLL